MHRIAVHGVELDFLAVHENGTSRYRTARDDMAIGEDEPELGIDYEARGLRGRAVLGVKRPVEIDLNRHDALGNRVERSRPLGPGLDRTRCRRACDAGEGERAAKEQQTADETHGRPFPDAQNPWPNSAL